MRPIDADAIPYTMLYKENWLKGTGIEKLGVWKDTIDAMPTIEPEPKKGRWIYEVQDRLVDETDDGRVYRKEKRWKCSECGYDKGFVSYKPKDKFCIECGAKMEREQKHLGNKSDLVILDEVKYE